MKRFIAKRVGYALISLALLSITIFLFVRLTGDPAVLLVEPGASKGDLEAVRKDLGLDRPLVAQYVQFMGNLFRGDLGQSFYYRTPVFELYLSRLPNSLLLAAAAMAISLVIGIPTGIIAAVRVNRWWDSAGKIFALLGLSLPSFWVGLVMILFFSVYLGWLPSSGSGTVLHLIMPAFALGWYFAAAHMRLTRSSMLEVLGSEYVKLARIKGLPEALVIGKHAFKNALIPVLTLAGINLVIMINVAVVVETVFAWPGIGRLLYEGDHVPRLSRRPGHRAPRRRDDRDREPLHRHPLRGDRPPHPVRPMSVPATALPGSDASDVVLVDPRNTFRASGFPYIAIGILLTLAFVAIFANVLTPYDPEVGNLGDRFKPPAFQVGGTTTHLLGTDHLGRDVLARLIFGARVSIVVGFTAVIVAGVLGTTLGILSGYLGGWVDQVIMRLTDTWLALPALTFAIFLAAIVGPSEMNIVIILGCHLLDALRPRDPRGGALAEGARLRTPGHRGGLLQAQDHAQAHPAQRAQLRHRPRHPHAGGRHRHRSRSVVPGRGRAAAQAGVGPHALRREEGDDGRLLVAHRAARLLHHADGAFREPPR